MPRARTTPASSLTPWQRRNAAAQAKGYRNYYDYRIHRFGAIPASEPAPTGEQRRRLRGHASSADLSRQLKAGGDLIFLPVGLQRNSRGQWERVQVVVLMPDGSERQYILTGAQASSENLRRLRDQMQAAGATIVAAPSIDVFSAPFEQDDFDLEDAA
jgi:hypothetical protein